MMTDPFSLSIASNAGLQTSFPSVPAIVTFWREAGPGLWFAKDDAFDRRFRDRFLASHEAAARGELAGWLATAGGALGLVLLLD